MKSPLLLLFAFPFALSAQITIDEPDFANASDTVRISSTSDFNVDISTTGPSTTWDFSMLVAESQTLLDFQDISNASTITQFLFGGFAPVDYQASYFLENDDLPLDQLGAILPVEISEVFQFTRLTPDSVSTIGLSITVQGQNIPFRSDEIEKRYELPLNYQDAYTGYGFTEMDLNPIANIIWRQRRTRNSEVDGWGTLSLPMGTFDVLRVRHQIEENDSIYQEFFGTPTWVGLDLPTAYIYEWWAAGELEPVLRVQSSMIAGNEVISSVEFRDNYNPLIANTAELNLPNSEVFPNPAQDEIYVSNVSQGTSYIIVDAAGRKVLDGVSMSNSTIDIHNLESGSYILILRSNKGWSKASFIKE